MGPHYFILLLVLQFLATTCGARIFRDIVAQNSDDMKGTFEENPQSVRISDAQSKEYVVLSSPQMGSYWITTKSIESSVWCVQIDSEGLVKQELNEVLTSVATRLTCDYLLVVMPTSPPSRLSSASMWMLAMGFYAKKLALLPWLRSLPDNDSYSLVTIRPFDGTRGPEDDYFPKFNPHEPFTIPRVSLQDTSKI